MKKLKKEYKFLILFIVILLCVYIYRHLFIYSYTLNRKWDLKLDSNYDEVMKITEDKDYIGKGISYRVFKYDKIDNKLWGIKFTKKDKSTKYYSKYSECINDYLSYININKFKCDKCLYYYKEVNNNELILLLNKNKKTLYVIENYVEEV